MLEPSRSYENKNYRYVHKTANFEISIHFDVFTLSYSKIHHPDWQRVWIIYCNSLFDREVHSSLQSEIFYQVDHSITIHNIQLSTDLSKIDLFTYKYVPVTSKKDGFWKKRLSTIKFFAIISRPKSSMIMYIAFDLTEWITLIMLCLMGWISLLLMLLLNLFTAHRT